MTTFIKIQCRSNVSYHFSSRFSRDAYRFSQDASRFSRDESRFSRESLKHLVWNILYMYYSRNVKKVKKRLVSIQGAEESY